MKRLVGLLILMLVTASAHAAELVIINWEEFLSPAVVKDFERATGSRVRQEIFADTKESLVLARKLKGRADIIVGGMPVLEVLRAEGLIQTLDKKALPNVRPPMSVFRVNPDYAVPYLWGHTGIAVRTDKTKMKIDSYSTLLEFARGNPGKAILTDDDWEFAYAVFRMYGPPHANFDDPVAIQQAIERYRKEGARLFRIQAPQYDEKHPIVTGKAIAGLMYNGDVRYHASEHKTPLSFSPARDGCLIWSENMAILTGAPNLKLAHQFINYLNEPEVSAANAQASDTGSGNPRATAYLSKKFLNDPFARPRLEDVAKCEVVHTMSPKTQAYIDKLVPFGVKD